MIHWFLQGQLSNESFQDYLSEPNQEIYEVFESVFKATDVRIIDAFLSENGNLFFFLEGSSDEVLALVMMFRSSGAIYDVQTSQITGFTKMNPVMHKASKIKKYYHEPLAEIERQKKIVKEAKIQIESSISYASRIQRAMLPISFPPDLEIGVHWQPLNVVGGDFYIVRDLGEEILLAVIDCSGHGVPGALLAALANSIFDQAILDSQINEAGEYLAVAHKKILQIFKNRKTKQAEGFDGTVCIYHRKKEILSVAGARNNLLVIESDGKIEEIKVSRKSVGNYKLGENFDFQTQNIRVQGQTFIMFTDGITDVMGGPQRTLFGKGRLKSELNRMRFSTVSQMVSNIILSLRNYQGFEKNRDDQAMMIFRPIREQFVV